MRPLTVFNEQTMLLMGGINCFRFTVGKYIPDLELVVFQKEQSDTETVVRKLSLGRNVKEDQRRKRIDSKDRFRSI